MDLRIAGLLKDAGFETEAEQAIARALKDSLVVSSAMLPRRQIKSQTRNSGRPILRAWSLK